MKNPAHFLTVGLRTAASSLFVFPLSLQAIEFWPAIYESYDKNPLGVMVGQPTGGYGVSGVYNVQGTEAAARAAFTIVEGGLAFGSFNSGAGRSVQVNASDTACGVGIIVDGGKAFGDTDNFHYDKLYCSYLVNFSNITTSASARAEVRTSTSASGGSNFQVQMDIGLSSNEAGTAGAQPALAYSGTTYDRSVNPAVNVLKKDTTYLMLAKFTQAGNQLGVSAPAKWTIGQNFVTLDNNNPGNMAVGQLVTGTGIPDNTFITGISGTNNRTITLSENTVSGGTTSTTLLFRGIGGKVTSTNVQYNHTTAPTVINLLASTNISPADITVGMYLTPTDGGIPVLAKVVAVAHDGARISSVTIDQPLTATTTNKSVSFRSTAPRMGTWSSGQSIINVVDGTNIRDGQAVIGNGIPANTYVKSRSGNQITISTPTTASGTNSPIHFLPRTGHSSLYALTLAQFESFIASGTASNRSDAEAQMESYLEAATLGTGPNQISVRIHGALATTGSPELGQGRYVHLVAAGAAASRQAYQMDELRYGFTLFSVTRPSQFAPVPLTDPVAFDGFNGNLDDFFYHGSGYGWKSDFYEVEETAATQGAFGIPNSFAEIVTGSGPYLDVWTRPEQSTDQGIRRRPDPAIVDMTKPYTVSFDYKLTSGENASTFSQFADRIQFGADSVVGSNNTINQGTNLGPNPTPRVNTAVNPMGAGTALNWMIGVVGANASTDRPMHARRWYFYDYTGAVLSETDSNPFVIGNLHLASDEDGSDPDNDDIPAINNGIWSFKVEVNPITFTYRATIYYRTDSNATVSKKYSKGGLRFRDNVPANTLFWGVSKGVEVRSFALDNIRVAPGVDYFPDWIASHSSITANGDKIRTADPDKDGKPNFLEYAMDGNPASGNTGGKSISSVTSIATSQYHALTVPIRSHFTFSPSGTGPLISSYTNTEGIRYRIEGSHDLVNWNAEVVEASPAVATGPALTDANYAYRSFRLTQPISATHPKGFIRVKVETTK